MSKFNRGEWITNGEVTGRYYDICYAGIALQDYKVHKGEFRLCTQEEIDAYVEMYGYVKMPIQTSYLLVDEVYQYLMNYDEKLAVQFKGDFKNKY